MDENGQPVFDASRGLASAFNAGNRTLRETIGTLEVKNHAYHAALDP